MKVWVATLLIPVAAIGTGYYFNQQIKRTSTKEYGMEWSVDKDRSVWTLQTPASETGGKYSVWHETMRIKGCGTGRHSNCVPPLHIHPDLVETFTVLKGQFTYILNGTIGHGSPGDSFVVPPGLAHTWWTPENATEDVEITIKLEPPGPYENFFPNFAGVQRDKGTGNPIQMIWLLCSADTPAADVPGWLWPHLCTVAALLGKATGLKTEYEEYKMA